MSELANPEVPKQTPLFILDLINFDFFPLKKYIGSRVIFDLNKLTPIIKEAIENLSSANNEKTIENFLKTLTISEVIGALPENMRFLIDSIMELRWLTQISIGDYLDVDGFLDNLVTERKMSIALGYYPLANRGSGAFFDDINLYTTWENAWLMEDKNPNSIYLSMTKVKTQLSALDTIIKEKLAKTRLSHDEGEQLRNLMIQRARLKIIYAALKFGILT